MQSLVQSQGAWNKIEAGKTLIWGGHVRQINDWIYAEGRGLIAQENVLLDSDGHIKVTDFGLAKHGMNDEARTNSFIGTMEVNIYAMARHPWVSICTDISGYV